MCADSQISTFFPQYYLYLTEEQRKRQLEGIRRGLTEEQRKRQLQNMLRGKDHPFYGKHHTEEAKQRIREKRAKQTVWNKGKHTGQLVWNKGKTGIYSKDTRRKMGLGRKGKPSPNKGKHFSAWNKGIHVSEKEVNRLRQMRLHQVFPSKDTVIEKALQAGLKQRNIPYETHKPIFGQPDIFILPNICIFADGDYWHNPQKRPCALVRDKAVNEILTAQGYAIYRFSEQNIRKDFVRVMATLFVNSDSQ